MKISCIYYHPQFRRSFLNLPKEIKKAAKTKIAVFKNDPFISSLKTHKLSGKLKEHWSFTVKGPYRVIFIFEKDSEAIFLDIGLYNIYK